MTLDLGAIEAAAAAATPGQWTTRVDWDGDLALEIPTGPDEGMLLYPEPANARFIAAASPSVLLALVARLRAAEALLVASLSTCEAHLGDKRCGAPSTSGWWDYEAPTGGYDQRCDAHRPLPEDDRACCRRPREDPPYAPQLRAWLALRGAP